MENKNMFAVPRAYVGFVSFSDQKFYCSGYKIASPESPGKKAVKLILIVHFLDNENSG